MDRFGAVVFPLHSQLISTKLCRFFIPATWIIGIAINSPYLFALQLAEYPGGLMCLWQWNEAFGETSSHANYLLSGISHCIHLYSFGFDCPNLFCHSFKTQVPEDSRRAIGQRKRATCGKGAKCTEDVHCYRVSVYNLLSSLECLQFITLFSDGQHHDIILWLPIIQVNFLFSFLFKLCCKPLYLLYFQWKLSSRS